MNESYDNRNYNYENKNNYNDYNKNGDYNHKHHKKKSFFESFDIFD
jgi:Zn-finger nucleic acid-binding protein